MKLTTYKYKNSGGVHVLNDHAREIETLLNAGLSKQAIARLMSERVGREITIAAFRTFVSRSFTCSASGRPPLRVHDKVLINIFSREGVSLADGADMLEKITGYAYKIGTISKRLKDIAIEAEKKNREAFSPALTKPWTRDGLACLAA